MKICLAVLCIVLLQGVHVNCQSSTIDSIMSSINSAYQQYQSGQLKRNLLQTVRDYVKSALNALNQVQNFINQLQIPKLPQIPQIPQAPGQGRTWQQQWGGR